MNKIKICKSYLMIIHREIVQKGEFLFIFTKFMQYSGEILFKKSC